MARIVPLLALAALALGAAPSAQAQTGVVLPFRGPGAGAARNIAVREARDYVELTPKSRVQRTARELGANLNSRAGRAEVAAEMGLEYFVQGAIRGRRTRLRVYGADGRQLASGTARRPIGRAGRADVARVMNEVMEQAMERAPARREVERPAEEEERPPAFRRERDEEDEEEEVEDEGPEYEGLLPIATMLVGVDARSRDLSVRLTDGRRRNYEAGIYPDVTLQLQVHPLAAKDVARGLYAQLDVAVGASLSTVERDPVDPSRSTDVETNAWRFMVQAGYLAPFAEDKGRVGVMLGFGRDHFGLSENQTMPGASYNQFRIGFAASFAAYGTLMQARIDAGYRFVLSAGELAEAFGDTFNGGAFDVGLSVGGFVDAGFAYGVRFGYTRYSLDLAGEASDFTGERATDAAVNAGIQIGWAFR